MKDNVNHPAHYQKPGHKECIDEMLEKFGSEKVKAFCELNSFKYEYRADLKGKRDEDLKKAAWYKHKLQELEGGDADA